MHESMKQLQVDSEGAGGFSLLKRMHKIQGLQARVVALLCKKTDWVPQVRILGSGKACSL
jgi:hypothetical protein